MMGNTKPGSHHRAWSTTTAVFSTMMTEVAYHRSRLAFLLVLLSPLYAPNSVAAEAREAARTKKVDFNYQIRPILSDKCFRCHGPDARNRKAGLRLDTKEGAFAGLKSGGHAIVPGQLEESELVWRVTADDESERMPPKSLGRTLSAREIELLKQWIEQGAEWNDHWS